MLYLVKVSGVKNANYVNLCLRDVDFLRENSWNLSFLNRVPNSLPDGQKTVPVAQLIFEI